MRPVVYGLMEPITLDLNDLATGKVELSSFQQKVAELDVNQYQGKHVQLAGCAPTWAHLLVAGKLLPVVSALDFLIDDGKAGKPVSIKK